MEKLLIFLLLVGGIFYLVHLFDKYVNRKKKNHLSFPIQWTPSISLYFIISLTG